MHATVIDTSSPIKWNEVVESFGPHSADVYFGASYHRSFETDERRAQLYTYETADGRLAYPFLLEPIKRVGDRDIEGGYHDIQSVYGFTGPIASNDDPKFLESAWQEFRDWCIAKRIIAEFVRFNPLLKNERFRAGGMEVTTARQHVVLNLLQSEDEIWQSYTSENRNMVRKAQKNGLECVVRPFQRDIQQFMKLYEETMNRNKASAAYYFSDRYFDEIAAHVPSLACAATLNGDVVAVSLFLVGPDRVHYHLSGCSSIGLRFAANNLLLHTAVLEAKRRGYRMFHFGGGRTASDGDALLKFKGSFSRERVPALIGRRVYDGKTYSELCDIRRQQLPSCPAGYLLLYRYNNESTST